MSHEVNPSFQIPARWSALTERSRDLLRECQDPQGAWPASPSFAPYRYSWFRDGCFIAEGADRAGLHAETQRFHDWCARVLRRERTAVLSVVEALGAGDAVEDSTYLPARYRLDGTRQVDDWWNFQVDGYGTWLWSLQRHLDRTGAAVDSYADAVEVAVQYLLATGREPCRDWWEENRGHTHVTTLAGVAAGLEAAVRLGTLPADLAEAARHEADLARSDIVRDGIRSGRLVKWLGGEAVDASLLAVSCLYDIFPLDDAAVVRTVGAVEDLLTDGGVHRYRTDTFYGGGQWPVLACLLAVHHARAGNLARSGALLDWVTSTADTHLLLPEQVGPRLAPLRLGEWEDRWGPSAQPLLWSHGMFLTAVAVHADHAGRRDLAKTTPSGV